MTRLKYNRDKVYIKDIEELSRMTGIEICHPVNRNYQVLFNGQTVLEEDGRVVYYFLLGMTVWKNREMRK